MARAARPGASNAALPPPSRLVDQPGQLGAVLDRSAAAPRIALDVEGNGLHAYRPQLCVLQLAWIEEGQVQVAIVDTLALPCAPLRGLLGSDGPVKVLHDLTFDARMLAEQGVELGNVRDTSVSARFLGEPATGLGALVSARLGMELDKRLQDHDWASRPFTQPELAYLAGDVRHLLALDDALGRLVEERGIAAEVGVECRYKLAGALAPPPERPPSYLRAKGYGELTGPERAVLRRLFLARDALAEEGDTPAFRIAPSTLLVALARCQPGDPAELSACCGKRRRLTGDPERWLAAVRQGVEDGAPPAAAELPDASEPVDGRDIALRKRLSSALSTWRRREAKHRDVDAQVILPGHRLGPLVAELTQQPAGSEATLHARLLAMAGLGACRVERYEATWRELAAAAVAAVEQRRGG